MGGSKKDKEKKSKSHKEDKKSKSHKDKHEHKDKRRKTDAGVEPPCMLTSADFFAKNEVFSLWLRKKKDVFFDQLPTDDAKYYFEKFVVKWNDGELSERYYELGTKVAGATDGKASARTGFKWGFVDKLQGADKKGLQGLRAEVKTSSAAAALTDGRQLGLQDISAASDHASDVIAGTVGQKKRRLPQGPSAPDPEALKRYGQQLAQKGRRDFRKDNDLAVDEMLGGKATGFEAKREKKAIGRHAAREREQSPDLPKGAEPYSTDHLDTFSNQAKQERLRRESWQASKKVKAVGKLAAHKEAEAAKMAALMAHVKAGRTSSSLWQSDGMS